MHIRNIKKLIESDEPIAIIRYFEWMRLSRDHQHVKYILLKINRRNHTIKEIPIPDELVPFIIPKLSAFKRVIKEENGGVWERHNFRITVQQDVSPLALREFLGEN